MYFLYLCMTHQHSDPHTNYDVFFLEMLENVLLTLKEKHQASDVEELYEKVLSDAKEHTKEFGLQKQVEFLSLLKQVLDAYKYAATKHANQQRESGEAYILHPLYVALNEILQQKHHGTYKESPIIAALLHDTVEDTDASFSEINQHFGEHMERIVTNLTNHPEWDEWKKAGHLTPTEKSALQFINAVKDDSSLSVKFDDRLHNLETIRYKEPKKQVQKILDTLQVGFIDHAEKAGKLYFLIQLYLTIKRYLTDSTIEEFTEDPRTAKKLRDDSLARIKDILSRHRDEFRKHSRVNKHNVE